MLKKSSLNIFTFILFSFMQIQSAFAVQNSNTFKEILSSQKNLEIFIIKQLKNIRFETRSDVNIAISKMTKGLYIHEKIKDSSLISEFLFRIIKSKSALPKVFSLLLNGEKIIFFLIFFIGSIIFSSFLSELEFSHKVLSWKRNCLVITRYFVINTLRLWSCFYFFGSHIFPTLNIYLGTVSSLKLEYPTLYKINFILTFIS